MKKRMLRSIGIKVYLFLANIAFERRGSLTQIRRKKKRMMEKKKNNRPFFSVYFFVFHHSRSVPTYLQQAMEFLITWLQFFFSPNQFLGGVKKGLALSS